MPSLRVIDHRSRAMAQRIHVVQMAAYAQEAALLGVVSFAPLDRTVDDLIGSPDRFIGAFDDDELAGVIAVGSDDEDDGETIDSLVVHPSQQRRGVGRTLLQEVIASARTSRITVQTAAGNLPALDLYQRFGFRVVRRWFDGPGVLELVKLQRITGLGALPGAHPLGAMR